MKIMYIQLLITNQVQGDTPSSDDFRIWLGIKGIVPKASAVISGDKLPQSSPEMLTWNGGVLQGIICEF